MNYKTAAGLIGKIGWIASFYPHLKVVHQRLASEASKNPSQVIREAIEVLKKVNKSRPKMIYKPVKDPELRVFGDFSFNRNELTGIAGTVIQLADKSWDLNDNANIIFSKSSVVRRKVKSTYNGELEAGVQAVGHSIRMKLFAKALFDRNIPVKLFTDSRSFFNSTQSKATEDPYSSALLDFFNEQVSARNIPVTWVSTTDMKADCLTKYQDSPFIYKLTL